MRPDAENGGSILSKIIRVSPVNENFKNDNLGNIYSSKLPRFYIQITLESRQLLKKNAMLMYEILPSLLKIPERDAPKSLKLITNPVRLPDNSAKGGNTPSTSGPSTEASSDSRQKAASPLPKEPIIVSARGFATRPPPFLRVPAGQEMLALSTHHPQYLYPYSSLLCEPVYVPFTTAPVSPNGAQVKPVFLIIPPNILGHNGQFMQQPLYQPMQTPSSSMDSESVAMSPAAPDSGSDCDERLSESDPDDKKGQTKRHNSSASEARKKMRDLQQQSTDRAYK